MLFISLFFLFGTFVLTALISALRSSHKKNSIKLLDNLGNRFFYRNVHRYFFPEQEFETLFFATTCAQNISRFLYAASATAFLYTTATVEQTFIELVSTHFSILEIFFTLILFLFFSLLFGDYLPRIFGTQYPEKAFKLCTPTSSLYYLLAFPFTYLFLKVTRSLSKTLYFDPIHQPHSQVKQAIIEIIQEAKLSEELDKNEKKLLSSLLSFCEHLTKEVMVPRIDVFHLEANTTIREAGKLLEEEGYSRVPVYEESVDNIVGILMYKDILGKYREYEQMGNDASILEAPISSIQNPPLYTPETKKISDLLQDFRKKQTHMAIVVDEYGGTEGVITIEDILEDIVGEITDEYDVEEELFISLPDGSWIVDPRMSLLDTREQLGIEIPQEGDFDTIGGYIFHCAGEIPQKGFKIQSDEFDVEVLKSNDRTLQKIRIYPRSNLEENNKNTSENKA